MTHFALHESRRVAGKTRMTDSVSLVFLCCAIAAHASQTSDGEHMRALRHAAGRKICASAYHSHALS